MRCINPHCVAYIKPFEYNVSYYNVVKIVNKYEDGAEPLIIKCPECGTEQVIFVTRHEEKEPTFLQKILLQKRPPQRDRGPSQICLLP